MKELYISPELKLISFAPAEKLAKVSIDFDTLLGGGGEQSEASIGAGDLDIKLD